MTYSLQVVFIQQMAVVIQDRESIINFLLVLGLFCLRVLRATQTQAAFRVFNSDDLEKDTRCNQSIRKQLCSNTFMFSLFTHPTFVFSENFLYITYRSVVCGWLTHLQTVHTSYLKGKHVIASASCRMQEQVSHSIITSELLDDKLARKGGWMDDDKTKKCFIRKYCIFQPINAVHLLT